MILILVPIAVLAVRAFNMAATEKPGPVEMKLAGWTVHRSVGLRTPRKNNPVTEDVDAISAALKSFGAMCLQCHGALEVEPEEFSQGLNPPAPALTTSLGEWSDDEIWKMVAAVRQLPDLTQEQRQQLQVASGSGHEHSSASGAASGQEQHGEAKASHGEYGASRQHSHEPEDASTSSSE